MDARLSRAQLLDAHLLEHARQSFGWARHNCCHFVAAWVRQVEGRDPMAGLPVTHGKLAARRLVLQLGGSLAAAWTRRLGREPIAPALAQVGDVVAVALPEGGAAVGLCVGRQVALLTEAGGMAWLPMEQATHAWRLEGGA